ncbi:MAG TPA: chromosomal replication initiator protein DnaA [Chthoniobacteraceae bacterium]|nr:chromosomal replication initiator protein DnaA [Chthoniobacteraceae bacterium]
MRPENLQAVWTEISSALREAVSEDTFVRWFKDAELVALTEDDLTLRVPNNIYQVWIEANYLPLLQSAITLALGDRRLVRFAFSGENPIVSEPVPAAEIISRKEREGGKSSRAEPVPNGMNPRNTFESFVVGKNNEYAHAACLAVGNSPGKTYNPLFIYGGVGLGKTHLMQAIGHHIATRRKGSKVAYITSETFTNEFIDAIQNSTLVKFRKRYRQADVLLIDDIQFFAGKERSQEEFFHTFNTLFDGHKQIVLSSDRPPSELAELPSRLVSRFEWGLIAELQPPDVETRTAILRKKAAQMEIALAPHIFDFIAERIRSNVRRLEGALTRVASYASLNGSTPGIEKIEHLLKDILQEEARRSISIDQIQKRVAEHFDVRLADMTSKRRPANIAFPRQIAMYLARELTKSSLAEIGQAFGGRDHGTVLHAHRLVKKRIRTDEKVRGVITFLDGQLNR